MRILLGAGEVERVREVLEAAVSRAREADDEIVVAVVDRPDTDSAPAAVEERVRDVLSDLEFDAEVRRLEGHAGSRLVDLAETEGFDRIALDGGERSPLGKVQLGSTAEFVLLNARSTVTVLR
jgi:nucleotide-binding universal stress UspA family protein